MQNDGENIADWEDHLSEDIDSDETYQREDDSDSDSCGSDLNVEDVESDAMTLRLTSSCVNDCESVSYDDDDDETHFNGVWYTTSHEYDSDCHGDYSSAAYGLDEDDDTVMETHISTNHVLHQAHELSTPFNLSTRESRANKLYQRACNGLSLMVTESSTSRYTVHASS
jgi:hypothetical protein